MQLQSWRSSAARAGCGLIAGALVLNMLGLPYWRAGERAGTWRSQMQVDAQVLRVDGGASANDLLMQLQADLLQVTCDPCILAADGMISVG